MEVVKQIIINLGLGVLGLWGYGLFSVRKHIANQTFKWSIFYAENWMFWLWALQVQLFYSIVMSIFPNVEPIFAKKIIGWINSLAGFDLEIPESAMMGFIYVLGAWALSYLVNKGLKKPNKIGKSKTE